MTPPQTPRGAGPACAQEEERRARPGADGQPAGRTSHCGGQPAEAGYYPTLQDSGLVFTPRVLRLFQGELALAAMGERVCADCRRETLAGCPHSPPGYRMVLTHLSQADSPYFSLLSCPVLERARFLRRRDAVAQSCGLTQEELRASFAGFEATGQAAALACARQYAEGFSRQTAHGLLFYGTSGTGKTHLAAAILNRLVARGFAPQAVNVVDLCHLYKASFGDEGQALREQLRGLERADLLLLDDWGQEKPSDAFRAVLYNLVNNRFRRKLPLVITTNLDMEALRDHVGAPLYSRILGALDPVRMVGEDYRRRQALARRQAGGRTP